MRYSTKGVTFLRPPELPPVSCSSQILTAWGQEVSDGAVFTVPFPSVFPLLSNPLLKVFLETFSAPEQRSSQSSPAGFDENVWDLKAH